MKRIERDYEREEEIKALRKAGWTLEHIGQKYNISRQRVHQILRRAAA